MPMALNLFDLVSEDHHPTQSHRFRVRPMTKVYSLRDMKREMRGVGREKACKKLKLSFKPIQNSFHDSLMEMEYKLDVVHPLHHLPPGYQGPHHQVACLHLQTLLIMLFQDAQDGVGGPPCQL